jgi:hypothetical protein
MIQLCRFSLWHDVWQLKPVSAQKTAIFCMRLWQEQCRVRDRKEGST